MSKKPLTPDEIWRIRTNYLLAVKMVKGPLALSQMDLKYHKGFFYLRVPLTAPAVPYRGHQIEAMTAELGKAIPQRADSDHEEIY